MAAESEEFKYVVRIAGVDLDGRLRVPYALERIKGIGIRTAEALLRVLGIDASRRLGELSEEEIERIEEAVQNAAKYLPAWMRNRRKDYETGEDLHLIESDLQMAIREDINRLKRIKCYRGLRHAWGLRVRGQRTRTTGRTGVTVGVRRKKKK